MKFPAKILLFGEYGILLNSKALAIPYPCFSGRFREHALSPGKLSEKEAGSNASLKRLLPCLKSNSAKFPFLKLDQFEEEVSHGLYFDSSIPSGFGLGSSGALTAAIYYRYSFNSYSDDYIKIKSDLAAIETCFHGVSSGIDPLTSLLGRAVLLENSVSLITTPDLTPFLDSWSLFLINAHTKANTGALVTQFMEQYRCPGFKEKIDGGYIPLIDKAITAATDYDPTSFLALMEKYSQFQLDHFERMIPATMRKYFLHGLESGNFYLKLCGSGGGGYLLALSPNRLLAENYFKMNHLDFTVV